MELTNEEILGFINDSLKKGFDVLGKSFSGSSHLESVEGVSFSLDKLLGMREFYTSKIKAERSENPPVAGSVHLYKDYE